MWNELRTGIANVIAGSNKIDSTVAVFKYNKTNIPAYPAITITPKTGTGVFADTMRNQRHYVFSVKCWQEVVNASEQEAEDILVALVDSLVTLFDANPYLDGNRLSGRGFSHPIPSDWRLIGAEQSAVMLAEILIDVEVIQ